MNITFQLKFDEKIYREQAELQFNIAIDKNKDIIRNYLIYLIGSLTIGVILIGLIANGGALVAGSILIIVGLIYFGIYLNYHIKVRKCKTEFDKQILSEVIRLNEKNNTIEIKITDEFFIYNDGDVGSTVRWTLFNSFIIIGDFLFLVLNKNDDFSAFYINKSQVGSKNYSDLKSFVSSILEQYPNNHRYKIIPKTCPELLDN